MSNETHVPDKRLAGGRIHRSGVEYFPSSKKSPSVSSHHDANATNSLTESSNSNTVKLEQHGSIIEVPPIIYKLVQKALMLRRRLKRYKDDEESKSALKLAEEKIALFTKLYADINIIPPDWKYDPENSSNLVIMSFRGAKSMNRNTRSSKKLAFNKHKIVRPKINDVPLDDKGLKFLQEFMDIDKDTPTSPAGCVMSASEQHALDVDVPMAGAVCDYAVNAFNKALETYDKKDKRKLTGVVLKKCGYNKRINKQYWFKLTLEAVEDGISGVYDSIVSCTMDGGLMRLFTFTREGKSKGKRENEIPRRISKHKGVKGNFDPADYYNYTGFYRRKDYDGYDYSNPGEPLFRLLCRH